MPPANIPLQFYVIVSVVLARSFLFCKNMDSWYSYDLPRWSSYQTMKKMWGALRHTLFRSEIDWTKRTQTQTLSNNNKLNIKLIKYGNRCWKYLAIVWNQCSGRSKYSQPDLVYSFSHFGALKVFKKWPSLMTVLNTNVKKSTNKRQITILGRQKIDFFSKINLIKTFIFRFAAIVGIEKIWYITIEITSTTKQNLKNNLNLKPETDIIDPCSKFWTGYRERK